MQRITKKYAQQMMGDHAHEIDFCIKDCENMGWKTTSFGISSANATIYARKMSNRWRFFINFN